ncbi:MAG TPA: hypothetical protein VEK57_05595 [Thermoanaerobaculia bacterium]|nr:hypothetical protein [Thermoanaerobaculia bacterium]
MTGLELGLLIASTIAIAGVFAFGWYRTRKGRLPAPMLFALRIFLGIVFLILGVIGSLLPVLQGWLFFLIAALILFPRSRFAVKACDKIQPRMPRLVAWLRRMGIGVHAEAVPTAERE